ncbi:amidase domain-containing protein [Streptomyces sp. NBC_01537]|uniref:amidase domain-containing protein n=1 Tax=Streptomyces sp. NBC_01537 TaxID=2903896 RepID=UPI00386E2D96
MTLSAAFGAVLALALSTAGTAGSAAAATTAAAPATTSTAGTFGRIAEAVLTRRTDALLDTPRPLRAGHAALSAALTRSEDGALSELRARKSRLAALGEAYTAGDTRVTVDRVRAAKGRATAWVTETTTLTYEKIRGDEPPTTGFQAHHELSFTTAQDGTWQLAAIRSTDTGAGTDTGSLAVNQPVVAVKTAAAAEPVAKRAATTTPVARVRKTSTTYNYAAMAAYAEKYWKNYNPAYRKFNEAGGDCTNFVSQSLKAGGWKNDSGTASDYRNWWYDTSAQTDSWVGVNEWSWFALSSKRTTSLANVYQAEVGDVVQMDFDRDGSKDHTMIVTYRSSSGVPYLTYHSVNTYRKSLASILASYPRSYYYAYRT